MGARCTGHCCDTIPLTHSPDSLEYFPENPNARFVLDNWKYLGRLSAQEAGVADKLYMSKGLHAGDRVHFYQCLRWDTATGQCTVYNDRPPLCRDHPTPEAGPCERKGCTSDAARNRPCSPLLPRPPKGTRNLSIYGPEEVKWQE